jgi:hypothetical protein
MGRERVELLVTASLSDHNSEQDETDRRLWAQLGREVLAIAERPEYEHLLILVEGTEDEVPLRVNDVVRIDRGDGGKGGLPWKVLRVEGNRAQVDLVRGSLLGPQWENVSDLTRITTPEE